MKEGDREEEESVERLQKDYGGEREEDEKNEGARRRKKDNSTWTKRGRQKKQFNY